MAVRMSTARRMDRARAKGKVTRSENNIRKTKERNNRDARMVELIKKGTFPYIPAVMSWLSVKLDKPASQLTEADAQSVAK